MPLDCIIIDDNKSVCEHLRERLKARYGENISVKTFTNPYEALPHIHADIDLLILDYELPELTGKALLHFVRQRGVSPRHIIILSSHDPDEIRQDIPLGEVLAVINKSDREQQEVLQMIMDAIIMKARTKKPWKD